MRTKSRLVFLERNESKEQAVIENGGDGRGIAACVGWQKGKGKGKGEGEGDKGDRRIRHERKNDKKILESVGHH
jgi:hypothetical protein